MKRTESMDHPETGAGTAGKHRRSPFPPRASWTQAHPWRPRPGSRSIFEMKKNPRSRSRTPVDRDDLSFNMDSLSPDIRDFIENREIDPPRRVRPPPRVAVPWRAPDGDHPNPGVWTACSACSRKDTEDAIRYDGRAASALKERPNFARYFARRSVSLDVFFAFRETAKSRLPASAALRLSRHAATTSRSCASSKRSNRSAKSAPRSSASGYESRRPPSAASQSQVASRRPGFRPATWNLRHATARFPPRRPLS